MKHSNNTFFFPVVTHGNGVLPSSEHDGDVIDRGDSPDNTSSVVRDDSETEDSGLEIVKFHDNLLVSVGEFPRTFI
jgi:hypothetical protein